MLSGEDEVWSHVLYAVMAISDMSHAEDRYHTMRIARPTRRTEISTNRLEQQSCSRSPLLRSGNCDACVAAMLL